LAHEAGLAVAILAGGMVVVVPSWVVTGRGWEKWWVRGQEPKGDVRQLRPKLIIRVDAPVPVEG
jgi:hypothetical protein